LTQDIRFLGVKNWVNVAMPEASEEGQGPHRTVEPVSMMMMMMMVISKYPLM
jgi:hypothetical protein